MNFDGYKPYPISRFSSLVEQDDATNLPLGAAAVARNCRYHLTSVRTRDGLQSPLGFKTPNPKPVTGLAALKLGAVGSETQIPIVYDMSGAMLIEQPVGSGTLVAIANGQVTLPPQSMQIAAAYNKGYIAFTDLLHSAGAPAVLNLATLKLDPLSMRPVGQNWQANTVYQAGEVVTPQGVAGNGHTYLCTVGGTSGPVQPAFPVGEGGVVVDNTVTWTETTAVMAQAIPVPSQPVVARAAGAGAFAANRDVYIVVTLVNGNGETGVSLAFVFVNTTLNDRFVVNSPVLAAWVQALGAPFAVTGYNVYEADVATGGAAPVTATFKKVNGGAVALGLTTNVNTTGAGAAPPAANSAVIVGAGNICAGQRFAVVLFVNRNGYISGMTQASVISVNLGSNGFKLYVPHIPTGPVNTAARIIAFTQAGQLSGAAGTGITSAGPYFWIPPNFPNDVFDLTQIAAGVTIADVVNGIQMTSTLINDNVSTTATFNFTDDYLKATLEEVSAFFRKIQITAADDIYYAPSLKRLLVADPALPSGWRVSLVDDPESFYGNTGLFQAAENNGERRTAIREYRGVVYPMKEESGYALTPSATDPSTWNVDEKWRGSGPCGPRAADVCTRFLCYVHRSGVYIFTGAGEPQKISIELPITWANINWQYQQTIWVLIDDQTNEIHIGVPYGDATTPNKVLTCNYEESPSFARPIHFSPFLGKEIASGEAYKWAVQDIEANLAIRAKRALVNPPVEMDYQTRQSQLLYASSNPDGVVSAQVPGAYNDNGAGIDWVYETACHEELMKPCQLGGVQANVDGKGQLSVTVLALRARAANDGGDGAMSSEIPMAKPLLAGVPYSCGGRGQNERFRLRFSNNKTPDAWGDLKWCAIMARPISSAAPR